MVRYSEMEGAEKNPWKKRGFRIPRCRVLEGVEEEEEEVFVKIISTGGFAMFHCGRETVTRRGVVEVWTQ